MSFVNYTEEQKARSKEVDMIDFLGQSYGYTFKKQGNEFHCIEHNSLVINQNHCRWYWNSQHIGGNNAIEWLMKIEGKTYPEAMYDLVGTGQGKATYKEKYSPAPKTEEKEKELQLPPRCKDGYKRVMAYLCKTRVLDGNIVAELIEQKKIYQDEKNNVVFVGYDEKNRPKFASVRGTLSDVQYRKDCPGSDKAYSFNYIGKDKECVFVFESPIDALSHATMFNHISNNTEKWKEHTRLSLSGTSDVALEKFLEIHPDIKNIYVCLDNDDAGRTASEHILKKYSDNGYHTQILLPSTKDYNSDLAVFISSEKNVQCIQKTKSI